MSVNFTPTLEGYKFTGSFRFWCQKVLPLVYDDSLSYYELLCKVVHYLNDVIENADGLYDDITALLQAYNQLQDYVNNYFTELNVQIQINNKLDDMAEDGTLDEIINEHIFGELNSEIEELQYLKVFTTPEKYGAVGNGVTDDTVAVRRALQEPYVLFNQTYKVTQEINSLARIVAGKGTINTTSSFLRCKNSCEINGITIVQTADGESNAIICEDDIIVDNVTITNGLRGIYRDNTVSGYCTSVIKNCHLSNFYGEWAGAIDIQPAGTTIIENNIIENVSNNINRDADGIRMYQGASLDNAYPVRIANNQIHNCSGRHLKISAVISDIENNRITNDTNFSVITNFISVDIQKGGKHTIANNYIVVPRGVNISQRTVTTEVTVRDNKIKTFGSRTTDCGLLFAPAEENETDVTVDALITGNVIECTSATSVRINGDGLSKKYVFRDNSRYDSSRGFVYVNSFGENTRLENYGFQNPNNGYFCSLPNGFVNVYSDNPWVMYQATAVAFANLLPNTQFAGMLSDAPNHANTLCAIEVLSSGSRTTFLIKMTGGTFYNIYRPNKYVILEAGLNE